MVQQRPQSENENSETTKVCFSDTFDFIKIIVQSHSWKKDILRINIARISVMLVILLIPV